MSDSQNLQSFAIPGGNFGYTGAAVDDLQSFKNCMAITLFDESGSTRSYARQMELTMQEITKALRDSPEADKIIQSHWQFDTELKEILGLTPLAQIADDAFDGCWAGGGCTALWYSECQMLSIMRDYALQQAKLRYVCNGILITMTDGMNYVHSGPGENTSEDDVVQAFADTVVNEDLESLVSLCIGVNPDKSVQKALKAHAEKVGYTRYLPIAEADEKTMAKVIGFVSQSIVSQSQNVAQGGPSTKIGSLTF